jgi:hypothetical protein
MRLAPIPHRVVQAASQQQLAEAVAAPSRSSRASSRARARSRTASSAGVGGCTTVRHLGQFAGIATVRLHTLAGLPRH